MTACHHAPPLEFIAWLAGALKRVDQEASEELIMYRTMLDLIKPKLVYLDLPLFMALLSDLFPGVEQPPTPAGALRLAIEADLVENNLQVMPAGAVRVNVSLCLQQPDDLLYGRSTPKPASACLLDMPCNSKVWHCKAG